MQVSGTRRDIPLSALGGGGGSFSWRRNCPEILAGVCSERGMFPLRTVRQPPQKAARRPPSGVQAAYSP